MDAKTRQGLMVFLALAVFFMLVGGCFGFMVCKRAGPAVPAQEIEVAAVKQPVVVSLLTSQHITTSGESTAYGVAYYREAVGYISTTVETGSIIYSLQSSPDKATWFDYGTFEISSSGLFTVPLSSFGPYLRITYTATTADVISTVWLALKE